MNKLKKSLKNSIFEESLKETGSTLRSNAIDLEKKSFFFCFMCYVVSELLKSIGQSSVKIKHSQTGQYVLKVVFVYLFPLLLKEKVISQDRL